MKVYVISEFDFDGRHKTVGVRATQEEAQREVERLESTSGGNYFDWDEFDTDSIIGEEDDY